MREDATSGMMTCEIVTPEYSFAARELAALDVPAVEGRLTVLPGHAPLVCALAAGDVTLRAVNQTSEIWQIGAGTMIVSGHAVTLLVRTATPRT